MGVVFFVWWNYLVNSLDSWFSWLLVAIGTTSACGGFIVSFRILSSRNLDSGVQIMDEWALFRRAPWSNNPDCRSGPLLLLRSHRGPKPAVWLDPGISKFKGWTQGLYAVDAYLFIASDNPSHVLRYCAQGSPPRPKAQWYYNICEEGIMCHAFIIYSIDGIYTHFWGITVNSRWFQQGREFILLRLAALK